MDKSSQIQAALRKAVGFSPNEPFRGIVTSVDGQTCKIRIASGLEVSDVKLKAIIDDSQDYYMITPEIGSNVLMISGDGTLRDLTVLKVDKVAKFEFRKGDLEFIVDSGDNKVGLKNGEASLKELFQSLADIIKQLKVFTPAGPSGTPLPPTIASVNALEIKFNQLLK